MTMDFDWKQIAGPLLNIGGTALGTLVGGPAGSVLGPLAGKVLADALGCEPTPEAVGSALGQPGAGPIVAGVEATHAPVLRAAERTYLDDIADARQQTVELAEAGSSIAWGAPVVSVLATGIFLVCVIAMFFGKVTETPSLGLVVGAAIAGYTQVLSFWLGSSNSSRSKDSTIADMVKGAAGVVVGAIKPRAK